MKNIDKKSQKQYKNSSLNQFAHKEQKISNTTGFHNNYNNKVIPIMMGIKSLEKSSNYYTKSSHFRDPKYQKIPSADQDPRLAMSAVLSQLMETRRFPENPSFKNLFANSNPLSLKSRTRSPQKQQNKLTFCQVKSNTNQIYSVRTTSKAKEMVSKGKPEIERIWRKIVNISNGIGPYNLVFASYAVYIGPGNNSALIKKLFNSRPWWYFVDTKRTANFVWTQWKDKEVLSSLPVSTSFHKVKMEENNQLPLMSYYKTHMTTRVCKISDFDGVGLQLISNSESFTQMKSNKINPELQRMHNKLEFNDCISNKADLLETMKNYYESIGADVFDKLPLTFNIKNDNDEEYKKFLKAYYNLESKRSLKKRFKNIWIVKPGEFTNRGQGICVCKSLSEIKSYLRPQESRSYIVQKYIENPFLINKRKFDIRCYSLITSINGVMQGYFYKDGYLRTSSSEFSLKDVKNLFIHLTNDAVQKHSGEYGKFENGNKMSYREFQKYIEINTTSKINFFHDILPQIKQIVKETIVASFKKLDLNKRTHCMEIFGYDFMIDKKFKPWLIEINTNPCLELSSPLLSNIIPAMVENSFRICVDSLFPAPIGQYLENFTTNKYELIFHQETDGKSF